MKKKNIQMSSSEMITMFGSITNTTEPHYLPLSTALDRIREGKNKKTIDKLRKGDSSLKKTLPIALFSGVFTGRKDDEIKGHSGNIILDFDHIDVELYKSLLGTDDFVRACWVSPSGDGLKVLIKISNPERHRDHFRGLKAYFDKNYGLEVDASGINEARACFESYDPDLISKEDCKVFGHMLSENAQVEERVQQKVLTDYEKIDIVAHMLRKAEEGEKHTILLRAAILCGGYISAGRMEESEAVRIMLRELENRETVEDMDQAQKTISDGLAQGKMMPIREVIDDEQRIKREMLILDGDMSFISSDDSDLEWIEKFAKGEIPKGLSTGIKKLDQYFLFKKEFTIFNGHSNVGKTTMGLYLMVASAVLHQWRWIIYSSENKTAALKMRLMEFLMDIPIDQMHYEERVQAFKWVNKHFTIISNDEVYSYTDLIVFAEKLIRQEKYDGFFIDPYNSLKITMSKGAELSSHEYHYQAASEMLTFSNKNDLAVWLNTHAITEAARRKGPDGLQMAPFAEDTEGGGKMVNRSDIFASFHRKIASPDYDIRGTVEIHIRKMRNQETGGAPSPFDEPILMRMNSTRTGFTHVGTGEKSFPTFSLNTKHLDLH